MSNSFNPTTGHSINTNSNMSSHMLNNTQHSTRSVTTTTTITADVMSTPSREKSRGITSSNSLGTPGNMNTSNTTTANGGYLHMHHRGVTAPARILGEVLKVHSDFIKQAIAGIENSFTALELQAELVTAFNELDNFLSSATLSSTVPSVSTSVSILNQSGLYYDNKIFNVLVSTLLFQPLREPFHRDSLQEVFDLYDGMEYLFTQEIALLQQQQQHQQHHNHPSQHIIDESRGIISSLGPLFGSSGTNIAMTTTHPSRPLSTTTSAIIVSANNTNNASSSLGNSKLLGHLNFRSLTSPYYDAMHTFQVLSKEGEVSLAQKILDRLLELSQQLDMRRNTNALANMATTNANNNSSSLIMHYQPNHSDKNKDLYTNNLNRKNMITNNGTINKEIEDSVYDLCNLVLRCLKSLTLKVKREEWVASTVHDNLQKVLSLFLLSLNNYVELESTTTHSTITSSNSMYNTTSNNTNSNSNSEVIVSGSMNEKREQDLTYSAISNQLHKRALKHAGVGLG